MYPTLILACSTPLFALAGHFVIRHRLAVRARAEREYQQWREWVTTMNREMRRYVTVGQAARAIGRPPSTLYTWINRKQLPAVKTQQGHVRVQMGNVYRAEHAVRGKGRTPTSGRVA